jgi:hypothetical protein
MNLHGSAKVSVLGQTLRSYAPTRVYDALWRFAAERQAILFRRVNKESAPWTRDPILQRFRFTNAYRASDRTSQYLIRNVIYAGPNKTDEIVFRVLLFKLFNKIETWELLESQLGELTYSGFSKEKYLRILGGAIKRKTAIYSSAYIMAPPSGRLAHLRKHEAHLAVLECMMKDRLPARIESARSMGELFDSLAQYPMFGEFLAFQLAIDINYSEVTDFTEMDFVVPGPGARSGITKCFEAASSRQHADIIRRVTDAQEREFQQRGIRFQSLWGRPLQLIDVQNLFCEIDKYTRASDPTVVGEGNRSRIKRTFTIRNHRLPPCWFPPKWGLNTRIEGDLARVTRVQAGLFGK